MAQPLIELKEITREFLSGEQTVTVLKGINVTINAGEMVAIVGASGSGKSTLMNILGCLDQPSDGTYCIDGRATNALTSDELAGLRRERFGFIFQRYHLLNGLTASGNVEIPAIYAGENKDKRKARAAALLSRLGLGERINYRPNQLSGGQQQRVSIARALMNGGQIILADEPTGALDTHSGQEVLKILNDLHKQGHTIIIVTHDMQIAQHAERIIELSDGNIISDRQNESVHTQTSEQSNMMSEAFHSQTNNNLTAKRDRFIDAFKMAILAMSSQRLRAFLTMLGIIIGIASVVSVVALGEGSRQKILNDISSMGTSTLEIYTGSQFGDRRASSIKTLRPSDADALNQQSFVHSVTPSVSTNSAMLRVDNISLNGTVTGVGEQFFAVRGYSLAQGILFNENSVQTLAQEAVIDQQAQAQLFPNENPIGKIILANNLPIRVVGVVENKQNAFGRNESLNVWIPYTAALHKMLGQSHLRNITVRIADGVDMNVAEQAIEQIMLQRHGIKDFFIFNTDSIRQTIESTTATMTLLVSMIAVISLVVGGIGVMNIMLVSVTERTREIGVRMAVGARSSDIMQQFLIEAVLVCLLGGVIGILLSLGIGVAFSYLSSNFAMIYSTTSIIAAFACSTLIGVIFGFFPARRAALMDPIHALERE